MEAEKEIGSAGNALCFISQATKDSDPYLCVKCGDQYHVFPISVGTASRLSHECSGLVEAAISGYSQTHAFAEVAKVLSERFKRDAPG